MPKKQCNKCKFRQDEFLTIGGRNYCKNCNSIIYNQQGYNPYLDEGRVGDNERPGTGVGGISDVDNLSAYDKKAIYNIFRLVMKGTERYIEASGCYSDWESRKQIRDNTEGFDNPKEAEESLVVALFGFKAALKDTPLFLQEELKSEFCSWISATGIDINNCRDGRLKHILFEINEIIKGEGDRLAKESALWAHEGVKKMSDEEFSKKMNEGFIGIQAPLNSEREVAISLIGKTYKDVESKKMFGGNPEKGEQSLNLILGTVSGNHKDFHFFSQNSPQISGYLTTNGAVIDNEYYEEIPPNSIQATPEQVGEVNRLVQNNSNEMKWIPVGISGAGFFALVTAGIVRVFRPSLR